MAGALGHLASAGSAGEGGARRRPPGSRAEASTFAGQRRDWQTCPENLLGEPQPPPVPPSRPSVLPSAGRLACFQPAAEVPVSGSSWCASTPRCRARLILHHAKRGSQEERRRAMPEEANFTD